MSDLPVPSHRRHRGRRVLLWVGIVIAVLVVASTATAVGLYRHFNGQLDRVGAIGGSGGSGPVQRADGSTAPPAAPAANYLLVGSDSRSGSNGKLPHTGGTPCHCADTIIVAHVPKGHEKAILVSIPRDSWVTIPEFTTAEGRRVSEHQAKINSALAEGGAAQGPRLLVRTVEALTGLHIDHYIQADFSTVVDVVNAVHGVDVCLSAPTQDWHTGIDLSAGLHHLDGVQALGYVRQRHGLPNSDLDRIKRQQAVIKQVVGKIVDAGILLHPFQLTHLLNTVTKSLTVDNSLSVGDMRGLASTFGHLDASHVRFATVPVSNPDGNVDGQSVVLLDQTKLDRMFDDVARGTLGAGKPARQGGADRSPAPKKSNGVPCMP